MPPSDFDTLSLRCPKGILLTLGGFSFNIVTTFPTQQGSLTPFFEEVMKWAYLKYPYLCLPEAMA